MEFIEYTEHQAVACLKLFDLNCPDFFAPNERSDYERFLDISPNGYWVVRLDDQAVVAAFGFRVQKKTGRGLISWIMVSPEASNKGIGSEMMAWVRHKALQQNASIIDIAASHLSAPFFSRFGAVEIETLPNGWGPDMHRVNMEWMV